MSNLVAIATMAEVWIYLSMTAIKNFGVLGLYPLDMGGFDP